MERARTHAVLAGAGWRSETTTKQTTNLSCRRYPWSSGSSWNEFLGAPDPIRGSPGTESRRDFFKLKVPLVIGVPPNVSSPRRARIGPLDPTGARKRATVDDTPTQHGRRRGDPIRSGTPGFSRPAVQAGRLTVRQRQKSARRIEQAQGEPRCSCLNDDAPKPSCVSGNGVTSLGTCDSCVSVVRRLLGPILRCPTPSGGPSVPRVVRSHICVGSATERLEPEPREMVAAAVSAGSPTRGIFFFPLRLKSLHHRYRVV